MINLFIYLIFFNLKGSRLKIKRPIIIENNDFINDSLVYPFNKKAFNLDLEHEIVMKKVKEDPNNLNISNYPQIQKYILLSSAHSYMQWHMDPSGTSVWFHLLKGSKLFYIMKNSKENIKKWYDWELEFGSCVYKPFFPDFAKTNCYVYKLNPGETLFLPSGFLHSVYTLKDSIAFAGNILNLHHMSTQLLIYNLDMERYVDEVYQVKQFERLILFSLRRLYQNLLDLTESFVHFCLYIFFERKIN